MRPIVRTVKGPVLGRIRDGVEAPWYPPCGQGDSSLPPASAAAAVD